MIAVGVSNIVLSLILVWCVIEILKIKKQLVSNSNWMHNTQVKLDKSHLITEYEYHELLHLIRYAKFDYEYTFYFKCVTDTATRGCTHQKHGYIGNVIKNGIEKVEFKDMFFNNFDEMQYFCLKNNYKLVEVN